MHLPLGSVEERLAHHALERQRRIEYLKTLVIFNAIIQVGNTLTSAIAKSPQPTGQDVTGKALDELKKVLLPGEAERLEERTTAIKKRLKAEVEQGPVRIRPVGEDSRKNKARRRRR